MSTAVIGVPEFRARSGRTVRVREDGTVTFDHANGYLSPESAMDAEELYQAKRDLDLGRWRDPVEPHFVAYAEDGGATVRVVDERDGVSHRVNRNVEATDTGFHGVAYRFFEAHPETCLWDDAKAGEIWVVTINGKEEPCRVIEVNLSTDVEGGIAFLPVDAHGRTWFRPSRLVTAARRIWPEDAS